MGGAGSMKSHMEGTVNYARRLVQTVLLVLLALLAVVLLIGLMERSAAALEFAASTPDPSDVAATPAPELTEGEADLELIDEDAPEPEETPTPLTFDEPFIKPTTAAQIYGTDAPGLRLEVFHVDDVHYKFTFYGTGDVLAYMQEHLRGEDIDYFFRYNLEMHAQREISLKGKIIFRKPTRHEAPRITKLSSELWCKQHVYHSKHPRIETNKISWLVSMPKWFNFDLADASGFDLTLYNAYDTRQKLVYHFDKDAVVTDTMLHTSLRKGGEMRVEVPDPTHLTVTITDPKLQDGYKNSPAEPGAIDPLWHAKAIINAKAWAEVKVEGKEGQDINSMDYYAGLYVRLKDNSNQYHATSSQLSDCQYRVEGNNVIMSLTLPKDTGANLKYIQKIAVDMNNGTVMQNNIYNVY